jgi:hypothetical protein
VRLRFVRPDSCHAFRLVVDRSSGLAARL